MISYDRRIEKEGLYKMEKLANFRDIGGYKAANNTTVKKNKIFRSGELVQLPPDDIQALKNEYQIQMIVDFRQQSEVEESPDDKIDGVQYLHLDILKGMNLEGAGLDAFLKSTDDPDHMMITLYAQLITSKAAQEGYKSFIELLLNTKNIPILFHCFAGKDRTGIGAAIILGILGVSKEDILTDYLKTNEQRKVANDEILQQMREKGLNEKELARIETLLYVKAIYLQEAFKTIEQTFGSFDQYIIKGLGLSENVFVQLQEMYTQA